MHYKVFLDTNIYDAANYSFRNDLFMQMRNYAESGMLEMQICSVVKNEVCRHIKNKIKGTVEKGMSSAAFTVDEPDGYVEDTSNMGTGDYLYDAFVISLQEMEDVSKFARIYLDVNFGIMLEYEYLNTMESYWDREDNAFLWAVMTEKVARFKANTVIGFTITIDKDGNPEFNDYVEMPSDIEIDYKDLIEVISCENRNSY